MRGSTPRPPVRVLVTGMSGTGKTTVLAELERRGHRTVDTDSDAWCHWVMLPDGTADWVWREDALRSLLTGHREGALFVSGCKSNQGLFYPLFDHIVVLTAPREVILSRIASRTNNPYGKSPEERALILRHVREVEPLLIASATLVIDATLPIGAVADTLEALAGKPGTPCPPSPDM